MKTLTNKFKSALLFKNNQKSCTPIYYFALILLTFFMQLQSFAQPAWPAPDESNIALFKPAKQINTFEAGHANRAVDGNKDGHWHRRSVSHTHGTDSPWWEVDLLDVYDISSITIHNRTDCCPDRLNNFTILVSNQPFQGNYGGEVFNADKSTFTNSKTFTNNKRGQYVRIFIEGNGILSLAEVEINGTKVDPNRATRPNENLALGKRARQSSAHDFATANRANDGDVNGHWGNGSVMHTQGEPKPFWEVDLGKNYLVNEVIVHNRTDCCGERLDDFNIYVTPRPKDEIRDRIFPFAENEKNFAPAPFKRFSEKKVGRYVRIELNRHNSLHLAEVEVHGTEIGDISLGDAESNVMYKVSIFRNVSPIENNVRSTITKSISEGMDFNRTVSNQDEKHWSLSTTAKLAVNYGIVSFGLDVTAGGGGSTTTTDQTSQGSNVTQSNSENFEISQAVPGGCTRYEFHKFVVNQSPITYKFNGKTYSWFRINKEATPAGDITVMVFPNDQTPDLNATDDNWVLPSNYQKVLQAHPNFIQD